MGGTTAICVVFTTSCRRNIPTSCSAEPAVRLCPAGLYEQHAQWRSSVVSNKCRMHTTLPVWIIQTRRTCSWHSSLKHSRFFLLASRYRCAVFERYQRHRRNCSFGQGMGYLFWMTLGPVADHRCSLRPWLMPDAVYTREGMTGLFAKARLFLLQAHSVSAGWRD